MVPLDKFREHFANLGKAPSVQPDSPDTLNFEVSTENADINESFTVTEIKHHIKILKNNKACGYDRIINEYLKNCPNDLLQSITKYFNIILESGIIPQDWTIAMIQPIYKNKGSRSDPTN